MSTIVAIDGPSGVGKGTVARAVARALDWQYVDTGAMYRTVAWKTQQLGQSLDDEDVVAEVAGTGVVRDRREPGHDRRSRRHHGYPHA